LNQPQILPPNTTTNTLGKIKNIGEFKPVVTEAVGKSLQSFISNPSLIRPTGARFIERKTITCLSQERSQSTNGSANYNILSTRSQQLTGLGAAKVHQSFLQQIPNRAQSTIGSNVANKRELSSMTKNTYIGAIDIF
jgi:G2/mitotic-specific cyclin-B, other